MGDVSRKRDKNMELHGDFNASANLTNLNKILAPCDSIRTLSSMRYSHAGNRVYKKSLEGSFNTMYHSTNFSKSKLPNSLNVSRL